MPAQNPYEQIRQDIRRQIKEWTTALEVLDRLEARGQTTQKSNGHDVADTGQDSTAADESQGASTWADVINAILTGASKPMRVNEIAQQLRLGDRALPAKTTAEVLVRSTLHRSGKRYGWVGDGRKPQHWRKRMRAETRVGGGSP